VLPEAFRIRLPAQVLAQVQPRKRKFKSMGL
jgi:hypothetical protein